jgi:hypothetical protein
VLVYAVVRSDERELAGCLRIELQKLAAGGLNEPPAPPMKVA